MNARETALIILNEIEKNDSYANLSIKERLDMADDSEKPLATELIYGVLRYKLTLDYVCSIFSKIRDDRISVSVRNILRIGIYQIMYLSRIPDSAACNECVNLVHKYSNKGAAGFVNGVLRNVVRNKDNISFPKEGKKRLMYKYSFPEDIVDIILRDYKEDAENILINLNENKEICIRPNLLKITIRDFEKEVLKGEYKKDGNCYYVESVRDYLSFLNKGIIAVQDRSSMMCAEMLLPLPGDKVLDLCAAPGGKSIYMAEIMENKGQIISCDIHSHRVELIRKNVNKMGAGIVHPMKNNGLIFNEEFAEKFDKILVDAPCSGFGVISGKPDIKWNIRNLNELCDIQKKLLRNALNYLKSDGTLLYSTCTINKDENERIVHSLENIEIIKEKQILPDNKHDGFYMAKIRKKN